MRYDRWFTGLAAAFGLVVMGGIDADLKGLPVIKQADLIQVWFAGRADFGPEQRPARAIPFRTAKWAELRPGDCTMESSEITIRSNGTVQFVGKVRSNDEADQYCIVLDLYDRDQFRRWHSPRICTPFELTQDLKDWVIPGFSIPETQYRSIAFAVREDHC